MQARIIKTTDDKFEGGIIEFNSIEEYALQNKFTQIISDEGQYRLINSNYTLTLKII